MVAIKWQPLGCYRLEEAAMEFPAPLAAACPSGPNRFVVPVTGVRTPDPFTHRRFRDEFSRCRLPRAVARGPAPPAGAREGVHPLPRRAQRRPAQAAHG